MRKVLVLEDEANIRGFIVINLRRAGYEVIEAGSGEEALEKLKAQKDIRVALLDVMLPGIDGFEVCRRLRAHDATIGIIMLTARSQEMDKVTGLMTGAALRPESAEPHTGEKRRADQADTGGIRLDEAVYGESRQGAQSRGDSGHRMGPRLLWRAEDRGREYPPPAAEDRGRHRQSHLYYHRVGLWLQMGRISAPELPGEEGDP